MRQSRLTRVNDGRPLARAYSRRFRDVIHLISAQSYIEDYKIGTNMSLSGCNETVVTCRSEVGEVHGRTHCHTVVMSRLTRQPHAHQSGQPAGRVRTTMNNRSQFYRRAPAYVAIAEPNRGPMRAAGGNVSEP